MATPHPSLALLLLLVTLFPATRPLKAGVADGEDLAWFHQAYLRERGFPELLRRFEEVRVGDPSKCVSRLEAKRRNVPETCVTPDLLALPSAPRTLEQWLDPAPARQDPRLQQSYYPGHPFLDGHGFYKICDYTWSTYYPFFRGRFFNDTFNVSTVANRSLVFWSLNYKGPDLSHLLHNIDAIPNHFFLVTHKQDNIRIPPWLLDHPKVLKVFAVNVPYPLEHPKLVPLPLGIGEHGRQPSRAINEFLMNASHHPSPQEYQAECSSCTSATTR
eukprot:GGOE01001613.1.p1 GENE.GGOE01001613.1~~GGOE01001613.1.p1  ORF type:complete len:273 (-),score=82.37 GGOE01001613.1:460-1278(-)